jgi:tetratricopeptide (TPR) repeat protein
LIFFRILTVFATGFSLCVTLGCKTGSRDESPYTPIGEADRDTAEAERLTREAVELLDKNPVKAEKLLRNALTKDLYHGPAHNNLGVLYLSQGELYKAAGEFEWSRKLMPGHPDPRINLALTLERAGRIDDALRNYAAALEVYPDHIAAMQGLVRLQLRHDRRDDKTNSLLGEIAFRGETEQWRAWAQAEVARGPAR